MKILLNLNQSKRLLLITTMAVASSGCANFSETLFTHYNLSKERTKILATTNAVNNFCLSHNLIDKRISIEFSIASAELLEEVVIDKKFYQDTYDHWITSLSAAPKMEVSAETKEICKSGEQRFSVEVAEIRKARDDIAAEMNAARNEERSKHLKMLSQMGSGLSKIGSNSSSASYTEFNFSPPRVSSTPLSPSSRHFLVNHSNGMTHCAITRNNYVLCH